MLIGRKIRQNRLLLKKRSQLEKNDQRLNFSRIVFFVLLIFFLSVTTYVFIFSDFLKIEQIEIKGNKDLSSSEIVQKIKTNLAGKYWNIFSRDNLLLINTENTEKFLREEFRKIEMVKINKKFPNILEVIINERSSVIFWCSGGPCYLIDTKGYAYAGINLEEEEKIPADLIKITDESARPVDLGKKIVSEDFIFFLLGLNEEIRKIGLEIEDDWFTPSPISQDIKIMTKEGWLLIFSANIKPSKAARTLKVFLDEEVKESERSQLEYVDLRVENKVFYKF